MEDTGGDDFDDLHMLRLREQTPEMKEALLSVL